MPNDAVNADAKQQAANYNQALFQEKFNAIKELPKEYLIDGHLFLKGNDPDFAELPNFKKSGSVGIVGTSGLRVIEIAAMLSDDDNTPCIILIDYSINVINFWNVVKEFFTIHRSELSSSCGLNHTLISAILAYFNQYEACQSKQLNNEFISWLTTITDRYTPDKIKRIIDNTHLLLQDWADTDTFIKIKELFSALNIEHIYAYPSNIVDCTEENILCKKILDNIEILKPSLTLHTNIHPLEKKPTKVYYTINNDPQEVLMHMQNDLEFSTHDDSLNEGDCLDVNFSKILAITLEKKSIPESKSFILDLCAPSLLPSITNAQSSSSSLSISDNRPLWELAAESKEQSVSECESGVHRLVDEDSSTKATQLFVHAAEFPKSSNKSMFFTTANLTNSPPSENKSSPVTNDWLYIVNYPWG